MGGAKRYPSIASCGDDGFRRLNPSYYVLNFITASQLPLVRKTDGVDNKTGSSDLPDEQSVGWISVIRRSPTTKRRVTPEPVIGPRLARTRWANPPHELGLECFAESYPSSVNPTRKVTW